MLIPLSSIAANTKDFGKKHFSQEGSDTLTIIFSAHKKIYYYESELKPDASNFKYSINIHYLDQIIQIIRYECDSKKLHFFITLKIQKKSKLDSTMKKEIKQIKLRYNCELKKITRSESLIVEATEKAADL